MNISKQKKSNEFKDSKIDALKNELKNCGFIEVDSTEFDEDIQIQNKVFTCNYNIGKNIYNKDHLVHIALKNPKVLPNKLAIHVKVQLGKQGGSAERKLPFEVLTIDKNKFDTILILDGEGFTFNAVDWLKEQICKYDNLKKVYTTDECLSYIQTSLK